MRDIPGAGAEAVQHVPSGAEHPPAFHEYQVGAPGGPPWPCGYATMKGSLSASIDSPVLPSSSAAVFLKPWTDGSNGLRQAQGVMMARIIVAVLLTGEDERQRLARIVAPGDAQPVGAVGAAAGHDPLLRRPVVLRRVGASGGAAG